MESHLEDSKKTLPIKDEPVSDDEPSGLEFPQWRPSLPIDNTSSEKEDQYLTSSSSSEEEDDSGKLVF